MRVVYETGDIAVVTTRSGKQFVAVYTLAPGIDYFWRPIIAGTGVNALIDPEIAVTVIGRLA